uniref:Uncharacterized protein n=2 Tax=Cacopsylla melanoneura TaxID=428564 RepID=A0A8D9EFU0_9HEMI
MSDRLSRKRNVDPSQSRHGSRDSSTSSQVRCGCQYFQTDSLLPEKQSLLGIKPNITTIMNTLSKTNDMMAPLPVDNGNDGLAGTSSPAANSPQDARARAARATSQSPITVGVPSPTAKSPQDARVRAARATSHSPITVGVSSPTAKSPPSALATASSSGQGGTSSTATASNQMG